MLTALIFTDDLRWQCQLQNSLERQCNCRVETATSWSEALRIISVAPRPELLFVDLDMVNSLGREFLVNEARKAASVGIGVISCTELAAEDEVKWSFGAGTWHHFFKAEVHIQDKPQFGIERLVADYNKDFKKNPNNLN